VICPGTSFTLPDGSIVNSAGTYVDTINSIWGCDSIITTNLSISNINVDAGSNVSICFGDSTTLQASGGVNYSWLPNAGLSNPNISNPFAFPAATTIYTVTVTDASGCSG